MFEKAWLRTEASDLRLRDWNAVRLGFWSTKVDGAGASDRHYLSSEEIA
jgi:hypothetical protein